MSNWYELKTWDDKTFWLKPERGRAALGLYERGEDISLGEAGAVAYKNIRAITETDRAYAPATAKLNSGIKIKAAPMLATAPNTILFVYVKKKLSKKEFEMGKYSFLPHYWLLDEDEGDIWVARTHPLRRDRTLPQGFELCTPEESERIEHKRSR